MNFQTWLSQLHPAIPTRSADSVLELAAEGATVPFIARYRKEKTGNLDEVAIRQVIDAKELFDETVKRQLFILGEIDKQKKLTPELRDKVLATFRMETLEDIYLPYKLKRKTKAAAAREAGLDPLAEAVWTAGHGGAPAELAGGLEAAAKNFVNAEKGIADVAAALQGAQDILTERLAEIPGLRELVRRELNEKGFLRAKKGEKAKTPSQYENYFDYAETVKSLAEAKNSHRYLALRRGWTEEELVVTIGGGPEDLAFEERLLSAFNAEAGAGKNSVGDALLTKAARLALKAHVLPSIEAEVHKALKDSSDTAAIQVFAENVGNLLLAAPFGPKPVLGVDPGLRTGCKLAAIEASGRFATHDVMYLQGDSERKRAGEKVVRLVKDLGARAVAVGNGTAGRETETFVRAALKEAGLAEVPVVMVSESGASVYSASEVAREEFPSLDVTVRGAISIARRLQDPLAELVKVDPKSIGVGQYQHDVAAAALKKSLNEVVDSCVNRVGVNLNTASSYLLARVSGIGTVLAKTIVEHRGTNGLFKSRAELLEIPRFSKKTFEQAAGFLRIPEGENPLDNTGVHPERYEFLEKLAARLGKTVKDLLGEGVAAVKADAELRNEVGEFTHKDIVDELAKPGRDPRDAFVPFAFLEGVNELKDLTPGLACPGIVTNVTNFGAFVDIGVHQDGLVHISQLADHFVKDPREVVKPGDRVQVRVIEVKLDRKQIALTMRTLEKPAPRSREHGRDQGGGRGGESRAASGPGRGPEHRASPGPGRSGGGDRGPRRDGPNPRAAGGGGGGGGPRRDGPRPGPRGGGGFGGGPDRGRGGFQGRPDRPHEPRPAPASTGAFRVSASDPNNPFSKLAALKGALDKAPGKAKK